MACGTIPPLSCSDELQGYAIIAVGIIIPVLVQYIAQLTENCNPE